MSLHTNRLAKLLAATQEPPVVLFGVVLTYTAATSSAAADLGVDFEGAGNSTPCIAMTSYSPAVGDNVVALSVGPDTIVLGAIS